jgi:rhodanese-related sulfurtransferase
MMGYSIFLFIFLNFWGTAVSAASPDQSSWLRLAENEANKHGYRLITVSELNAFYEAKKDFVIIDVRPDYEYRDGHLPNAFNIEFDPGDNIEFKTDKQKTFLNLLGPDKLQLIVIYCRNYACLRSGIAARRAVQMGYRNILRLPEGYQGWQNLHSDKTNINNSR